MASPEVEELLDIILEHIHDGKVIPVIGEDLIRVEHDGRQVYFYPYIASKLAERLDLIKDLPQEPNLNDVIYAHLSRSRRRGEIHSRIRPILNEAKFCGLPEDLVRLAGIRRFNLFISLTFDSLLAEAIDKVRFGGDKRTQELGYCPGRPIDLPASPEDLVNPVVYHLLGKLSAQPDEYVLTDEDMLEFLYDMQRVDPPPLLRAALRENHLLFIGCTFSDWLARFFIRSVRRRRLSRDYAVMEALVNDVEHHSNLIAFLTHFSPGTRIVSCSPGEFVALLLSRYLPRADEIERRISWQTLPVMTDAQADKVFLSYATEDSNAARRLYDVLGSQGIEIWFDAVSLKGGDFWELQIERRIRDCSYFLPIISAHSAQRTEGFFRAEWRLAEKRSSRIMGGTPFIIPVVIDETPHDAKGIPDCLKEPQWVPLRNTEDYLSFSAHMKDLVREYRRKRRRL